MKKHFFLSTFLVLILITMPGTILSDSQRELPNITPSVKRLELSGGISGVKGVNSPYIFGYLLLKYKGQPVKGVEVTLGGIRVPQKGMPGRYQFDDLIPPTNTLLQLRITYPSIYPNKREVITIDGIVTNSELQFIQPPSNSSKPFNPFVSKSYKISWNETFGEMAFHINCITDHTTVFGPVKMSKSELYVKSSIFQQGKSYHIFIFGTKYLKIKGPVTSGSSFFNQKQDIVRVDCIRISSLPTHIK